MNSVSSNKSEISTIIYPIFTDEENEKQAVNVFKATPLETGEPGRSLSY